MPLTGFPPGTDPRALPGPVPKSGPITLWFESSKPAGTGGSCPTGSCSPMSCGVTPSIAEGVADSSCTSAPDDASRSGLPGGSGGSGRSCMREASLCRACRAAWECHCRGLAVMVDAPEVEPAVAR